MIFFSAAKAAKALPLPPPLEPYFFEKNIATNLSKNNDFANSVHLSIDMSSY